MLQNFNKILKKIPVKINNIDNITTEAETSSNREKNKFYFLNKYIYNNLNDMFTDKLTSLYQR